MEGKHRSPTTEGKGVGDCEFRKGQQVRVTADTTRGDTDEVVPKGTVVTVLGTRRDPGGWSVLVRKGGAFQVPAEVLEAI